MEDIWHYPRSEAAETIMATLSVGLVSAVSIIEPRRKGKTTFLLDDLLPAARRHGYLPIYFNLAATTGALEPALAAAIRATVASEQGVAGRLRRLAKAPVRKISGRGGLQDLGLSAEVEFASDPAVKDLATVFAELAGLRRPVLFLLDEVHRLAEQSASVLAWGLRSLLDGHRKTMKVVATSSSAASYDALISGEKKAFNRWFTRIPLPPLGEDFLRHLCTTVARHYPKHSITAEEVTQAFETLGRSPKFIRDYLTLRILNPLLPHGQALAAQRLEAEKESGYEDQFGQLLPLQRIILVAMVAGQRELFSEDSRRAMGSVLTGETIGKPLLQRALRSLAEKGWIIRHERGEYLLTDELFAQWLREQIRSGLLRPPAD